MRDGLGRIIEIEETNQGATTTIGYTYDEVGQLVEVKRDGLVTESYVDTASDSFSGTQIVYNLDDQLERYGALSYTYNAAGQLRVASAGGATTTYTYGAPGELERVEFPDGRTIEYQHDALGRRIARLADGAHTHRFIYGDRIDPVAEVDASGVILTTGHSRAMVGHSVQY